ncbi:glycosyltransferase family 39 protein [Synechococcus sp. RSCCF101]|uniref:ArnT family glycosyltransferase n=1 Tax=Synechococcus sp. RSCCF101 TaxID=2511069 RepID=UPI001785D9E8|nr:4-amino-4-deoxy-L-arabinose transferase [Synechococcus sp. RSCCF101]
MAVASAEPAQPACSLVPGLLLLWVVGCLLALPGLGDPPLRDWDEATVARVALELSRTEGTAVLLPTLWDQPYLNKPPGLHGLIALLLRAWPGLEPPPEGWVRLIPALLSTLVVPLGGLIQWRLRPGERAAALATAAILLTLLPLARHGRLAMLDGTQLSLIGLLWWQLLSIDRSRADRRRALTAGLAGSGMLLLKAPLLLPVAVAAALPLLASGEERRRWRPQGLGWLGAGLLPGLAWHLWHGAVRGGDALWLWGGDGAGRVLLDAGEGSDLGWRVPLTELLEGGWPWLLLWPVALAWAWQQRNSRWGRWALALQMVLAASILPLKTQLPWYSHPLWLPFAVLCGPVLAWLIEQPHPPAAPPWRGLLLQVPKVWLGLGVLLLLAAAGTGLGWIPLPGELVGVALACGLGWSSGGLLLLANRLSRRRIGAAALTGGSVLGLAVLLQGPLWLWELQETWPVQAPAALALSVKEPVALLGHDERPSLNWYAGQRIRRHRQSEPAAWLLMGPAGTDEDPPKTACRWPARAGGSC